MTVQGDGVVAPEAAEITMLKRNTTVDKPRKSVHQGRSPRRRGIMCLSNEKQLGQVVTNIYRNMTTAINTNNPLCR